MSISPINPFYSPADLMDALSDPRAFLSGQEKRAEQMKAMGIEEADIQAVKDSGADNSKANKDGAKKDEPKKGPSLIEKNICNTSTNAYSA